MRLHKFPRLSTWVDCTFLPKRQIEKSSTDSVHYSTPSLDGIPGFQSVGQLVTEELAKSGQDNISD
jgi:hypothetical protein